MRASAIVSRKLLLIAALSFLGLVVGFASALYPAGAALGIVALAGLVLLWVMPDLAFLPTDVVRIIIPPLVFSIGAVPVYFGLIVHDLPWISIRRVLFLTLAGSTLIILSGSARHRSELVGRLKDSPLLALFCVGFLAAEALAALTSSPVASLPVLVNEGINYYLPLAAVIISVQNIKDIQTIIRAMLLALFVTMLCGCIEAYLGHPFLYKLLPSWSVSEFLSQNPNAPVGDNPVIDGPRRVGSTYMVPLSWAEFIMMMAPFALQRLVFGQTSGSRLLGFLALCAIPLCLSLSGSRGGYVGFIADTGLFAAACGVRYTVQNRHSILGAIFNVVLAMGSAVTAAAVLFVPAVSNRVLGGGGRAMSNQGRHEQWALAWPKFFSRPLFGYGPGSAVEVVGWASQSGFSSLDSYVINIMISTGIFGLMTFFPMILLPVLYCFDHRRKLDDFTFSLRASISASIFGYAVYRVWLNQTENNTLLYVMLGLLFAFNSILKRDALNHPLSQPLAQSPAQV